MHRNFFFLFLFFLFLFILNSSFAQVKFQEAYGGVNDEESRSVQQTNDGGYIITGWTKSFGAGNMDIYLIKTNEAGDTLIWTKTFGGSGDEVGNCVRQTADGGYIIAGWTTSFGAGSNDFYYIKTDSSGNLLWSKTIGGASLDIAFSVVQTDDGGYIIAGWTASYGAGYADYYLVKTNSSGDTLWTKIIGGAGDDYALWVEQTTDRGYIITGTTNTWGAGGFDTYIVKTDSTGEVIWSKTYGGLVNDGGSCIQQTSDGGYINVGNAQSFGVSISDFYLIRTDGNGDTLWTRTYGGPGRDGGNCVRQTTDGNFITSGTYASGAASQGCLIKTDGSGDTLWTKQYGGANSEENFTVWQTMDETFILSGYSGSFGTGGKDIYLIKTDSLGNSGCNDTLHNSMVISRPPTVVTSPVPDITSAGILADAATLVGSGGMISKLCSSCIADLPSVFQSSDTLYANQDYETYQWYLDNNPLTGDTNYFLVIPQTGNYSLVVTDRFGCIARLDSILVSDILAIASNKLYGKNSEIRFYPNPVAGSFAICGLAEACQKTLRIYTMPGELVYSKNIEQGNRNPEIDISFLSEGVYIIQMNMPDNIYHSKLIKK